FDAPQQLPERRQCAALLLLDLMPVMTEEEKRGTLTPFRQLLRRVEVINGEVAIEVIYDPRPDYARITPRLQRRGDSIHCGWGARVLNLRSDATFEIDNDAAVARFTLTAGESRTFALGYDDHTPAVLPSIGDDAIERTVKFWRD